MAKKMIIGHMPEETRVAITDNGKLMDLVIERSEKDNIVGNIYKGRIKNILPGMQAMFVDIGREKNAFLYTGDIKQQKGGGNYSIGQEIIIQIIKEPIGDKGPRATTNLTLAGRYAVLMPLVEYIGVSRRIESDEERDRLKTLSERIKPKGMGLITRTVAQGKNEAELRKDVEYLANVWGALTSRSKLANAPALLYRDVDLVVRMIRDYFDETIDEVIVDNHDAYNRVLSILQYVSPGIQPEVKLYNGDEDIFTYYELSAEFAKLSDRRVWLECGGYIVIDHTEALTVVDVNTGRYSGGVDLADTVFRTNAEAAAEIARQIHLRDIGGIIIIDFIDMGTETDRQKIIEILVANVKADRTKTSIVGITGLGLVEMTRKKVRQNLEGLLHSECPYCRGKGYVQSPETVAINIKRSLRLGKTRRASGGLTIQVHSKVADYLNKNKELALLEKEIGKQLTLEVSNDMHPEAFSIFLNRNH